jgi:ABC-type cobalamin transport system ATPase subunit
VGIELPTVEVRFERLTVEARCHVGSRALPTLLNTARNVAEAALGLCGVRLGGRQARLTILRDVSGAVRPSRMTLLLGPPSSGKTTLLLALAGKLDPALVVAGGGGEVSYNGFRLGEFVPQKTAAYISQTDVHVGEMTVKETLDFSARCQGVGAKYGTPAALLCFFDLTYARTTARWTGCGFLTVDACRVDHQIL